MHPHRLTPADNPEHPRSSTANLNLFHGQQTRPAYLAIANGGITLLETAYWVDWRYAPSIQKPGTRMYFGHETCPNLLPPVRSAVEFAKKVVDNGGQVTYVTPFLTEDACRHAVKTIEHLRRIVDDCEVVCGDWGLVHILTTERLANPVAGRLLTLQVADPTLGALCRNHPTVPATTRLRHLDGTWCRLLPQSASPAIVDHYRTTWVDRLAAIDFLNKLGLTRCELNNVCQGLKLRPGGTMSYSLHLPDVLVSVMRACPALGEDFDPATPCQDSTCDGRQVAWIADDDSIPLFRQANALYYRHDNPPADLATMPIDRLVHHLSPFCDQDDRQNETEHTENGRQKESS